MSKVMYFCTLESSSIVHWYLSDGDNDIVSLFDGGGGFVLFFVCVSFLLVNTICVVKK
jgi:hypothetical protein